MSGPYRWAVTEGGCVCGTAAGIACRVGFMVGRVCSQLHCDTAPSPILGDAPPCYATSRCNRCNGRPAGHSRISRIDGREWVPFCSWACAMPCTRCASPGDERTIAHDGRPYCSRECAHADAVERIGVPPPMEARRG